MTPEQRERVKELCQKIQVEKDPNRFSQLAEDLDRVLSTVGSSEGNDEANHKAS
jgi:hypothetical protein